MTGSQQPGNRHDPQTGSNLVESDCHAELGEHAMGVV